MIECLEKENVKGPQFSQRNQNIVIVRLHYRHTLSVFKGFIIAKRLIFKYDCEKKVNRKRDMNSCSSQHNIQPGDREKSKLYFVLLQQETIHTLHFTLCKHKTSSGSQLTDA